ncbi:MAG: ATP-binding protein, partial [Betaproteobacteria bacterium]
FSNVSHEFRTPLTLMIGPTEDALESPERALQGEELESVHRNELRLLKLVNTLLDFSRIEAGRVTASFEPTDLALLTANLASAFRSATERAGLELIVACPPLAVPVYVDREMWEKIVLNLLSNAFKFTFKGSICVEIDATGNCAELRVRDTGIGIAANDLEHVFDRFYRIEHSGGRTHEGSGIGLALVRELVGIHGGTIKVSSSLGAGTTFTARIPLGAAHLPPEQVAQTASRASLGTAGTGGSQPVVVAARSYVQEALRWLPSDSTDTGQPQASSNAVHDRAAARILLADDNADMRDYLKRLLAVRFHVEAVGDGVSALEAARKQRPDVIVSDVMMPRLDGFGLLAALRAGEDTRTIPFILLSARAGEEARIDGLHAGADDYLVKPFSARELIARVEAQLVRAKMRALEEAHAVRLSSVFSHAPVGVAILKGPEHLYEFANRAYQDLVPGRQLVGKTIRAALPELAGQGIYELLDDVYRSGKPYVGRSVGLMLMGSDGNQEESFFDFVYQPLFDERNQVSGIAVVAFNVTELTKARREAEAANRAKDEFLAMLGHELRNPLAPIVTALQLMRLRNVPGAERERTIIERQVKHVVSLVDDLLDVSRITRGQVQLKREPVDMADIVAKAIEMTGPAIEERRHTLSVNVPRGLVLNGDAARLAQVMSNLLTNATKYTDSGGKITVTGRAVAGQLEVIVADTGRGIAAEMLPRVFDLFSQERQEIDRSDGGLGLGLAIVKSLIQGHGGTVHANSAGK